MHSKIKILIYITHKEKLCIIKNNTELVQIKAKLGKYIPNTNKKHTLSATEMDLATDTVNLETFDQMYQTYFQHSEQTHQILSSLSETYYQPFE